MEGGRANIPILSEPMRVVAEERFEAFYQKMRTYHSVQTANTARKRAPEQKHRRDYGPPEPMLSCVLRSIQKAQLTCV